MKEKEFCLKWFMVTFYALLIVNCNEIRLDFYKTYYLINFTILPCFQIWGTVLNLFEYIKERS